MKMRVQNVIYPTANVCDIENMYYRTDDCTLKRDEDGIHLDNCSVSYDTYFNSFSIYKWLKYTSLENLNLNIAFVGTIELTVYGHECSDGTVNTKKILVKALRNEIFDSSTIQIKDFRNYRVLSFSLRSIGYSIIKDIGWETESINLNDIKIVINNCNFHREKYIYRNLNNIANYLDEYHLKDSFSFYIADNSHTIDRSKIGFEDVQVFQQNDVGATGGFTRGLIELLNHKDENKYSHVIMMDDDVLLEPESLFRLHSFLKILKEEYKGSFIGGALLRMDQQNIQTCHGGGWDFNRFFIFHKLFANLSDFRNVVLNEIEENATTNAWWFQCIPLTEIGLDNLPYPFFFHMEDEEYDLRNCKHIINLNSISVWHEPFEYKPGSHLHYYNVRNCLITHMMYYDSFTKLEAKKYIKGCIEYNSNRYLYKNSGLSIRGALDALKGPEWLSSINAEEFFEEVLRAGYKKMDVDTLEDHLNYDQYFSTLMSKKASLLKRVIRKLTINGHLYPGKGINYVNMFSSNAMDFLGFDKVIHYDSYAQKIIVTKRSIVQYFKTWLMYLKVCILIDLKFEDVRKRYRAKHKEMTNEHFWRKYIGIEEL